MTPNSQAFVFILAGGSGERFWPLSRKDKPKQLLQLFSNQTLLGDTLKRVQNLAPTEQTFILTNQAQKELTKNLLPTMAESQILAEPAKRDTAPAAALATAIAYARDPEAVVVLLPSDQLIKNEKAFQQNLLDAIHLAAQSSSIMTLAIPPTYAATGFGYMELGEEFITGETTKFQHVKRFVEKPDLVRAQDYKEAGNYFWNAGIFIWKASTFLKEAQRLCPELAEFVENFPTHSSEAYIEKKFPLLPKISIDYALMEKASSVIAARATFDWDDVGSWSSLADHLPKDSEMNVQQGTTTLLDSKNNTIYSPHKHVSLCGVSDLVIVETEDALLICHKDRVQDVKKLLPHVPDHLL